MKIADEVGNISRPVLDAANSGQGVRFGDKPRFSQRLLRILESRTTLVDRLGKDLFDTASFHGRAKLNDTPLANLLGLRGCFRRDVGVDDSVAVLKGLSPTFPNALWQRRTAPLEQYVQLLAALEAHIHREICQPLWQIPAFGELPPPQIGTWSIRAQVPIDSLRPAPENDDLYRPVDPNDPAQKELAASIRKHGICEPLVATQDGWILSGHRRYAAAGAAGLRLVPVRFAPFRRDDDPNRFLTLLRECNRQRVKSLDEMLPKRLSRPIRRKRIAPSSTTASKGLRTPWPTAT